MTHLVLPGRILIISPPTGTTRLPLVEIDKTKLQTKYKSILLPKAQRIAANCSYGAFGVDPLAFTAWELCHAAKKTELTRTFTSQRADELALVFSHEHYDRFVWDTDNLRCADGSGLWLEDFSGKSLAGRISEALAYLTMTKMWGYAYWDRITSVWLRAARNANITHADMVRVARFTGSLTGQSFDPQPDFVFEKPDKTVALMEAKGSFVAPRNDRPNAKGPLKHGLDQLAKWAPLITPSPAKCIAIGSLLREASDPCRDPSLILHVDPPAEGTPKIEPVEFRPDEIRRGNFAAWLIGMGFRNSGLALADRREIDTAEVELPVATLNGVDFALSIQGWRVDRHRFEQFSWWPFDLWHVPLLHRFEFLRDVGVTGVYALGLEVRTLRTICAALRNPSSEAMMDLPTVDFGRQSDTRGADGFYGSVMRDGSLLGIISSRYFEQEMRTGKFKL
ncbi:MAG: hypothetical protein IPL40_14220 [Proteobacteria bacterium]|nr:hypothetical protein [Pseudomonadota bacterium]